MKKSAYVRLVLITAALASCNQYLRPCEDVGDWPQRDYPHCDTTDTAQREDLTTWETVEYDVFQDYSSPYTWLRKNFRPFVLHDRPRLPIGAIRVVRGGFGLHSIQAAS